jgi:ribose 5-phosphate isomerase B
MADLMDKTVITEDDLRGISFGETVRIGERALVTPLAADLARERHIQFQRMAAVTATPARHRRKIAIGADHGGFEMKEALKGVLSEMGAEFQDFGTNSPKCRSTIPILLMPWLWRFHEVPAIWE